MPWSFPLAEGGRDWGDSGATSGSNCQTTLSLNPLGSHGGQSILGAGGGKSRILNECPLWAEELSLDVAFAEFCSQHPHLEAQTTDSYSCRGTPLRNAFELCRHLYSRALTDTPKIKCNKDFGSCTHDLHTHTRLTHLKSTTAPLCSYCL